MRTQIGEIRSGDGNVLLQLFDVTIPMHIRPLVKHRHTQLEIGYVVSGSGRYSVDNVTHPMEEGDVFVFSSNEFHCITEISSPTINILTLQFEPRYLFGASFDSLSSGCINLCFAHSDSFQNRIPASEGAALRNILLQIKQELSSRAPEAALLVKSYLNFFLVTLIRSHNFAGQTRSFKRKNVHAIRDAVDYIHLHLSESIALSDIAEAVHISPSHLSSLFKDFFQVSPWNYIIAKRIDRAISMLLDKDNQANILDIALECGFNNATNFNRAFRKHTGLTPSEYRDSPPQQP